MKKLLLTLSSLRNDLGFLTETRIDLETGQRKQTYGVFSTALVCILLNWLPKTKERDALQDKLARALFPAQNDDGTWSFNGHQGEYPADVDDTVLALVATQKILSLERAKAMLQAVVAKASQPNGLVRTWLDPSRHTRQDVVVNLHVLLAFQCLGLNPPKKFHASLIDWLQAGATTDYYCCQRYITLLLRRVAGHYFSVWPNMITPAPGPKQATEEEMVFRERRSEVFFHSPAISLLLDHLT